MREFIKRTLSVLLILASLLLLFLPSAVKISGVKASEWRELRNETVEALEESKENFLIGLEGNLSKEESYSGIGNIQSYIPKEQFKDDLKDSGMPSSSIAIKKTYNKIIGIVKELVNNEVSFKEIFTAALFVPEAIKYSESLLEFKETESGKAFNISKKDTEGLIDILESIRAVAILILAFFLFIILMGLFAAVTQAIGKMTFVKYIYFSLVAILSIALMVGPFLLNGTFANLGLAEPFEKVVIYPNFISLIAVVLTALLSLLVPVFIGKSKAKESVSEEVKGEAKMDEVNVLENEEIKSVEETQSIDEAAVKIVEPKRKVKIDFNSLGEKFKFIKNNNPKKFIALSSIVAGVLVAVIVLGIIFIPSLWNNYKTPLNIELKFINSRKAISTFEESIIATNGFAEDELKEIFSIIKKSDDFDEDELSEFAEEIIDDYIDEYGENYKAKYVIDDKEELDKDELRDVKDQLKETAKLINDFVEEVEDADSDDLEEAAEDLGLTRSEFKKLIKAYEKLAKEFKNAKITKGYELDIHFVFNGSELDEPEVLDEYTTRVYCINGRWVGASFFDSIYAFISMVQYF